MIGLGRARQPPDSADSDQAHKIFEKRNGRCYNCGCGTAGAGDDCQQIRGMLTKRGKQMDTDVIARNLACVEKHFHSEATDEVETALGLYTNDIVWNARH
jgi:hypothetical protein